jgi:isocitrate/isopropylmalate dehydrogenase
MESIGASWKSVIGGLGFAPAQTSVIITLYSNRRTFSAPKYAGQYKVNPIAMLLTVKLMFDWLKESEMATRLESAIARVIAEGKVRTYDMGGKNSTLDVAKAVASYTSW